MACVSASLHCLSALYFYIDHVSQNAASHCWMSMAVTACKTVEEEGGSPVCKQANVGGLKITQHKRSEDEANSTRDIVTQIGVLVSRYRIKVGTKLTTVRGGGSISDEVGDSRDVCSGGGGGSMTTVAAECGAAEMALSGRGEALLARAGGGDAVTKRG